MKNDIKEAFDKVVADVEPYIKHKSTEDWQVFIAHLQEFGMAYEKRLRD